MQNNELTEECANRVPAVAISEYEERVEDLMRKLGELQASNAKLHEKNEELGGHSTALDTEMQALRAAFQSRVDRLEAEKLEALLEAAEVKKQMEESERQSLEKSTEVNAKLTTMEQQNEVLARKLAELYLLYSKNCEVLSEVEAKYEAIRVKFATAENRIRALQSTENLASTVFTDAEQELARLHAENDALIETRNQLEAKCTALLEDIAARNNTSDNGQRLSLQELGAEPKRRSDRAEIQALEDTLKANTGDSQILRQQAQLALSTALQSEEKMRMMIVQNRDLQSQIKKLTIERDSLLSRLDSSQMFATAGSQKLKLDLAKMTQQYNELQKQLLEYKAGNSGTVGIQAEVDKMRQENDRAAADVAASGLLTATTNMEALHQKLDLLHAENQHLSMEAEQAREAYKKLEAEKTQLVQDFLMSEEWDSQTSKLRGMMEREMENTEAMLIGKLQELEDQLVAREGKIAELNRDMQARMDEALEAQLRLHERIVTLDDELRQQKMVNALSAASVNQLVVEKEELAQYYDSALQDRNELARKFEELRRKHGAELSTSPPSATSSKTVPVDAGIVARRRNSLFNAVAAQAIAINKKVVTVHCANCNLDGDHESDACPKKVFSPPK